MAKKANDLAHTKWMCKYHIVFTPKYRRKIIYNQYKEDEDLLSKYSTPDVDDALAELKKQMGMV